MVRAMEKLRVRRMGVQVHWAPSSIFREMVAKRATLLWAEAEAMAMAVLASTDLLRVSEAIVIRRKEQGVLRFFGVNNKVGWQVQPMFPWAGRWLEFLHRGRQRHMGRTEHSGSCGSMRELEEPFKLFLEQTSWPELRWHNLRRLGAAQLWASGCRGSTLQLAGGWGTPTIALHYATPAHSWACEERCPQPVPVYEEDAVQANMGTWCSQHWWAAWIRKEVRDSGLGRRHGERLGEEKSKQAGAKRPRTVESQNRRSQSDRQAQRSMTQRENISSRKEMLMMVKGQGPYTGVLKRTRITRRVAGC